MLERHSRLSKAIHVTAYALRFIRLIWKKWNRFLVPMRAPIVLRSGPIIQLPYKPEPDLSCEEIELAQNYLLYEDQRVCPPSKEHEAQYSLVLDRQGL